MIIIYILGIITGLIIAVIVFILELRNKPAVSRTMRQLESKLKTKGTIIEPQSEDLDDWINKLKSNENN